VPPIRARWHHLANTIELVLPSGPPKSTQTANRLVQPFLHSSRQSVIIHGPGMSSNNCPLHMGDLGRAPSNTCFLEPIRVHDPNGISISSAVLHSSCQSVMPFHLKIAPSRGNVYTHLYMVAWVHPTQHPNSSCQNVLTLQWDAPSPLQNCPFHDLDLI